MIRIGEKPPPTITDRLHPEGSDWRESRDWALLIVLLIFAFIALFGWAFTWLVNNGWIYT